MFSSILCSKKLSKKEKLQILMWGSGALRCFFKLLSGVVLDDKLFVDFSSELGTLWLTYESTFHFFFVECKVFRHEVVVLDRFFDDVEVAGFLTQADSLAGFERVGWDIHTFAIYSHVTVVDELTCLTACSCKSELVYDCIQTGSEKDHEVFTMNTFHFCRTVEDCTELALSDSIHETELLLLLKLHSVFGKLSSLCWSVVTRGVRTAFEFFACATQ